MPAFAPGTAGATGATFALPAIATLARTTLRAMGLEFLKAQHAIAIFVHSLEVGFRLGRILLSPFAGFEFIKAQYAVVIRIKLLKDFFRGRPFPLTSPPRNRRHRRRSNRTVCPGQLTAWWQQPAG